jgi:SAM-dependent methyltransferase
MGVDIACGEGYYTRLLRRREAGKVVGIDLSERMIELARCSPALDLRVAPSYRKYGFDVRVIGKLREGALGRRFLRN